MLGEVLSGGAVEDKSELRIYVLVQRRRIAVEVGSALPSVCICLLEYMSRSYV